MRDSKSNKGQSKVIEDKKDVWQGACNQCDTCETGQNREAVEYSGASEKVI